MHTNIIDFYSKVPDDGLRYVSPQLTLGSYILIVECASAHPHLSNKRNNYFGSRKDWVMVEEVHTY